MFALAIDKLLSNNINISTTVNSVYKDHHFDCFLGHYNQLDLYHIAINEAELNVLDIFLSNFIKNRRQTIIKSDLYKRTVPIKYVFNESIINTLYNII